MDDQVLALQAQKGDLRAYSALVEMYQERAVRIAYSFCGNYEDARDLAQEAFVKAYEALNGFSQQSKFYTWFYRILANHCKDFLRKKKVRSALMFWSASQRAQEGEDVDENPQMQVMDEPSKSRPDHLMLSKELGQNIDNAIKKLPPSQRSIFAMRYLEDMSLQEIAGIMNLTLGAVKANLWQAGQKIKKDLAGEFISPQGGL